MDLLFDTGNIRFDGRQWSAPRSAITIFDGVFVAENVHSGDVVDIEQKRNLYRVIIGDTGVRLADQEADLAQRSRGKTTEITTAAKAVQAHVPVGMKIEAFQMLPVADDVDTLITDQEKRVETARQAGAIKDRNALSEFPLPELPAKFEQLLGMTIDDIARDAEARLAAHIAAHDMADGGGNWLAEGLPHAVDTCPFCGQEISGSKLIAAFRSVFSERYEALVSDIGAMRATVSQLFGDGALARLEHLPSRTSQGRSSGPGMSMSTHPPLLCPQTFPRRPRRRARPRLNCWPGKPPLPWRRSQSMPAFSRLAQVTMLQKSL